MLAPIIVRIIAMLTDETYAIDSKVAAPEGQCVFYGRVNCKPMFSSRRRLRSVGGT